ncbi:MAG: hypothetical protein V7K26_17490 [Nostoc sp.]|uniref:hypothetical protein n=1 Tax=Nostoc sp. TaxID=1180 RepID=UPI002FF0D163
MLCNIWRNYTSGELLYRSTSSNGNLSLGKGTSQLTEGVRVYKFRNGIYEYWVWDGTLDNPQSGTLEVYKNNRILGKIVEKVDLQNSGVKNQNSFKF